MEGALQRYLDGITALLSVAAGELFALGLPGRMEAARWLRGLGFGVIAWALVATYRRDVLAHTSGLVTTD